jgi:hypothetical protein
MSKILQVLSGFALVAILALSVGTINVAFAQTTPTTTPTKSVPGPIVGAGLPILGLGYGAYWLVRRYRRKSH